MPEIVEKYFPALTGEQKAKFDRLLPLYEDWNNKINVISRKDMENFYVRHVLHSLAISMIISFSANTEILDIGTGGGFPGIPLAILFPEVKFTLVDSIAKKIKVVNEVAERLSLSNVFPLWTRAEEIKGLFDFVVCRAVTSFPGLVKLTAGRVRPGGFNSLPNGIICLKGGNLAEELQRYKKLVEVVDIHNYFSESFFETKQIVYLPA
ncbi:MAG TPA: 16S rRNA (guanine(527)-N(7))-methyltransferase RsmG [Bacteroidales bacterium]|nr:16S rRNA (guanine(527)-N(7))-methyltransferase RsmG [Bacteroidales bacterium]